MGRIKAFFCLSCLDGRTDQCGQEVGAFDRNIDVSHLATPHIPDEDDPSSRLNRSPSPILPREQQQQENNDDSYLQPNNSQSRLTTPNNCAISIQQNPSNHRDSITNNNNDQQAAQFIRPSSSSHHDNGSSQLSSTSPVNNIYEEQRDHDGGNASLEPHQQRQPIPPPRYHTPTPPVVPRDIPNQAATSSSNTKLSYDIISVREPLAKILAERQQLLQQQQQRQLLGDHDYIEVYGERGSSCFYEEIAGSVTSSATYDQIGSNSNHNYQALINAYAVANRQPNHNQENGPARPAANGDDNMQPEANYATTSNAADQTDSRSSATETSFLNSDPNQSTVQNRTTPVGQNQEQSTPHPMDDTRDGSQLKQSIPVYSVINKATRRSNSNMRTNTDNNRPPKPPPKNPLINHQQQQQQQPNSLHNQRNEYNVSSNFSRAWSPLTAIPSTSSNDIGNLTTESRLNLRHARLPQPPPRFSKHSAFNHTNDRPLPSPNGSFDVPHNNNNGHMLDRNLTNDNNNADDDEDDESLDNGYELLKSNNNEDDQIDVGYEKIKEPNRYSGGSISSQLNHRQLFDNGGYESVQPIYSSPSNALVEPNYEAIAPATASELAAAATARLNSVSVIEQVLRNQDQ